jgi:hypothetical protein
MASLDASFHEGTATAPCQYLSAPVEPVWAHLKRSLANPTKHNLVELTAL